MNNRDTQVTPVGVFTRCWYIYHQHTTAQPVTTGVTLYVLEITSFHDFGHQGQLKKLKNLILLHLTCPYLQFIQVLAAALS